MLLPFCITIGGLGLMLLPLLIMADVIAKWQMEWPRGELYNQYLSFTADLEEAKLDTGESLSQIK